MRVKLWVAEYRASIHACAASLSSGLGKLKTFLSMVGDRPLADALSQGGPVPGEAIDRFFSDLRIKNCDNLGPPQDAQYKIPRSGSAETLGIFGLASAWLLRTESPELALIIGLLGFGFFGSLAAGFVREFRGTPGNELPPLGFIIPALVRGIGAAILVFLIAKGGMAIFTRGDATPNAYAIFFACFVGAVFSEDVWSWARARQKNQFAGDPDKPKGSVS